VRDARRDDAVAKRAPALAVAHATAIATPAAARPSAPRLLPAVTREPPRQATSGAAPARPTRAEQAPSVSISIGHIEIRSTKPKPRPQPMRALPPRPHSIASNLRGGF
jgi:hypothetical protein